MLKPNLPISELRAEFQRTGRIVIRNFLDITTAKKVHLGFLEITKKNLWYQASIGNPHYYNPELYGLDYISEHFAYRFSKFPLKNYKLTTLLHTDSRRNTYPTQPKLIENPAAELPENNTLHEVASFLNSDEMHDFLTSITDKVLSYEKLMCFASKYSSGDFLGAHTDRAPKSKNDNRVLALVLSMSQNWHYNWGGQLLFFGDNYQRIIDGFNPEFNTLVVFSVPQKHLVTPISNYCQGERLAITGWYNDLGEETRRTVVS